MNSRLSIILIILFSMFLMAGCDLLGDIFQTGVGVGIFIAVAILVLIFLIGRIGRKR